MMIEQQKRQLCEQLLDLIDKIHGAKELIEMDDPDLARVQLMDVAGQVNRVTLKLRWSKK